MEQDLWILIDTLQQSLLNQETSGKIANNTRITRSEEALYGNKG